MTAIPDESVGSRAGEMNARQKGAASLRPHKAHSAAGGDTFEDQGANALPIDQNLPRLLYELAVRLPMRSDIQALCVWLYEPVGHAIRLHVLMADLPAGVRAGMDFPVEDSIAGWVWQHQQLLTIHAEEEMRFPEFAQVLMQAGIRSFCGIPLMIANRRIGVLGLASTKSGAFGDFKLQYMERSSADGTNASANLPDFQSSISQNCERGEETFCQQEQVLPEDNFEDIIGRSASLRAVLDQVKIVAPTDSTVLILGETGTGKELIARAIHNRSARRDRPFVRLNCAAIPLGLLESELFGHERGAFTGAIARRIGRFELAHGGTLFLDEIGDIPLELQSKLLRVLQEQEFERLGSTQTTRVDVRVVAATSRELPRMVADQKFRSDLYYRLYVFPVRLPALRERREDIALLVRHFVDVCARRMKKRVEIIPNEALDVLLTYQWPGNVRELQNFIERAVILSPGKILRSPLTELTQPANYPGPFGQSAGPKATTLEDAARDLILQALAESNWVVGGPKGAAARIGLRRTTLISKMQRLGIRRA
jgi:formate hydrogenlyase transcriptional activator